jgi:hypothetical protein
MDILTLALLAGAAYLVMSKRGAAMAPAPDIYAPVTDASLPVLTPPYMPGAVPAVPVLSPVETQPLSQISATVAAVTSQMADTVNAAQVEALSDLTMPDLVVRYNDAINEANAIRLQQYTAGILKGTLYPQPTVKAYTLVSLEPAAEGGEYRIYYSHGAPSERLVYRSGFVMDVFSAEYSLNQLRG